MYLAAHTARDPALVLRYRSMSDKKTMPVADFVAGNDLFGRAAFAIGLDGKTSRHLLREALEAVSSTPHTVTKKELEWLLPEIETRLCLLVPDDIAAGCIARVRKLLETYDLEHDE